MRMDNETYRLKVEGLLGELGGDLATRSDALAELEQLALTPRKARYFLKALSATAQPLPVKAHFYRIVMAKARSKDVYADLERQIRHAFYESRDEAKELVAGLLGEETLPALFQVISLTEEGWLAGELIRLVLTTPPEKLKKPLETALASQDYLLQCLAIYLIGKSGDEGLLDALAKFYRNPVGEKPDRLEKKSYDALIEGAQACEPSLILSWLKDRSARVRDLALTVLTTRRVPEASVDLVSLLLVDSKTRHRAAQVLLRYVEAEIIAFDASHSHMAGVIKLLQTAKQDALAATLRGLMREESPAVRQVAVELVRLLPPPADGDVVGQVRRLVAEDPIPAVQVAALLVLEAVDAARLVPSLVEVFTANGFGQGSAEVLEAANQIMDRSLGQQDILRVQEGIRTKQQRREAALERFAGSVEWWRHDV